MTCFFIVAIKPIVAAVVAREPTTNPVTNFLIVPSPHFIYLTYIMNEYGNFAK
jgi:hypothetical protein